MKTEFETEVDFTGIVRDGAQSLTLEEIKVWAKEKGYEDVIVHIKLVGTYEGS